jgi:hypothetical protein
MNKNGEYMKVIKFQDEIINGDHETVLNWIRVTDKEDLMVEVFTDIELFEDLSIYWKELEKRSHSTLGTSFDWCYSWWKHFGKHEQRSLFIVSVWDGTKLVAIAPFYKGYSTFGNIKLEVRLNLIGSGGSPNEQFGYKKNYAISDSLDILVDRAYLDVVTETFMDILTPEFLGVDLVSLDQIREDSYIKQYLYPRLKDVEGSVEIEQIESTPCILLSGLDSIDDYFEALEKNVSEEVRDRMKVVETETKYDIKKAKNWEEVKKAVDVITEFRLLDKRYLGFIKDVIRFALGNGWLHLKRIGYKEGGNATQVILKYKERYYDCIDVFDQSHSHIDSRLVLFFDMIRDAIKNNIKSIELLGSKEQYDHNLFPQAVKEWKLSLSFERKEWNIPLLLNRVGSFIYTYINREHRLFKDT